VGKDYKLKTGESTEYMSTENPLSKEEMASAQVRRMDCMDCHNRPTHIFRSPSYSVNLALATGKIDSTLPYIKRTGVELLAANYTTTDSAMMAIRSGVSEYYQKNYPKLTNDKESDIEEAIMALQDIYQKNYFPEMKVRWDVYADDVGHLIFRGCYRCHDGAHESADGKTITRNCDACHSIMSQGPRGQESFSMEPVGLEFKHPEDIGEAWKEMMCNDCHSGEQP
jgi:hypothetical protein